MQGWFKQPADVIDVDLSSADGYITDIKQVDNSYFVILLTK